MAVQLKIELTSCDVQGSLALSRGLAQPVHRQVPRKLVNSQQMSSEDNPKRAFHIEQ